MAQRVVRPVENYTNFLSRVSKRRQSSPIRALQPLLSIPGMLSLGGGMPNPSLFPIQSLTVALKDGTSFELKDALCAEALQYSGSFGLPSLVAQFRQLQIREHQPPLSESQWNICVTNGSQEALCRAFEALIDEGDPVIVENPTYSGALAALRPLAPKLIPIQTDSNGMIPETLERVLKTWNSSTPAPKILYLIPTGQNPSGSTLPLERRREIYRIASENNLLILEDDPYWNLRFKSNNQAELKSFFSMDVDGRVLRFDSLSKVISSGLRVGWVTGPTKLVEHIQLHQQAGTMHPSGLSQAVVSALLQKWGEQGWNEHVAKVQAFYQERRDKFAGFAEKHLTGLAEWSVPTAGMFLWFKTIGIPDTRALIQNDAIKKKVVLVPGAAFDPEDVDNTKANQYVRASFSTASYEDGEEAIRRFAELLKDAKKE